MNFTSISCSSSAESFESELPPTYKYALLPSPTVLCPRPGRQHAYIQHVCRMSIWSVVKNLIRRGPAAAADRRISASEYLLWLWCSMNDSSPVIRENNGFIRRQMVYCSRASCLRHSRVINFRRELSANSLLHPPRLLFLWRPSTRPFALASYRQFITCVNTSSGRWRTSSNSSCAMTLRSPTRLREFKSAQLLQVARMPKFAGLWSLRVAYIEGMSSATDCLSGCMRGWIHYTAVSSNGSARVLYVQSYINVTTQHTNFDQKRRCLNNGNVLNF